MLKYPNKTYEHPRFPVDFEALGYSTRFYYTGDINFGGFRSYATMSFQSLVTEDDFSGEAIQNRFKWGVHDEYMFERLAEDLRVAPRPFMYMAFTLSSHEPFTVPMETQVPGEDSGSKLRNSIVYTDKCLGEFFERMSHLHEPGQADALDCLVLQLLLEVRIEERRESESREEQIIRGIASRLTGRFQEQVSIPELIEGSGLSVRTFYRLWKRCFPDSPIVMLQEKRMAAAEHLLATSPLRIKEISELCGFSTPLYFYQSFRRKHGCSPAEFRRKSR